MVVPKGWEKRLLSEVCEIYRGGSPRPIDNYIVNSFDGINWIKISDTKVWSKYIFSTHEKITLDGALRSRKVFKGDFLLSNSMSFGRPYILKIDGCIHDGWLVLQNYSKHLEIEFLYYILCSEQILRQYNEKAAGSGVQNLNKELVSSVEIIFPTLEEQIRISKALSEMDELINSLEKLIEKKKAIKQGAMQQLLTGRKRLPRFSGEWTEELCGKMGNFFKGRGISMKDVKQYGYPCIMYGDIYVKFNTFFKKVDFKIDINTALKSVRAVRNDILFTASGETAEEIGKCVSYQGEEDIYIGGDIIALRPNSNICSLFLAYAQNSEYVLHQKAAMAQGHTVVHINQSNIKQIKVLIPPTLREQEAIADVLLSMDTEIEALAQKLEKSRQIKQGMMQELLTGRIRFLETSTQKQKKAKAAKAPKSHNEHFHEAVILSTVVSLFASAQFPLGRFRRQKFAYLLHRHAEESTQGFLKKAAGPYNPTIRYKDEKIALKAGYVVERGKGKFVQGEKSNEAVAYFVQWYGEDAIEWIKQFQYRKNDDLEVLTTVAEAIVDLKKSDLAITVESVKQVIRENPEWRPKLDKDCFSDFKIQSAIKESQKLFG